MKKKLKPFHDQIVLMTELDAKEAASDGEKLSRDVREKIKEMWNVDDDDMHKPVD